MTVARDPSGMLEVYNFWLGLGQQFFGLLGAGASGGGGRTPEPLAGLTFPNDQIARAALMTQQALQSFAQNFAPILQAAGTPGLLGQWMSAMSQFPGMSNLSGKSDGAPPGMLEMFAPWTAAMSSFPSGQANSAAAGGFAPAVPIAWPWLAGISYPPAAAANADAAASTTATAGLRPLQATQQAWLDAAARLAGTSPQAYASAFERTFGGVSDALGFGPIRKLQATWQELLASSVVQNEARVAYILLVQGAFAAGLEGLLQRLAEKAEAGEHIDSVLALLRLWAVSTEDAVHLVLQSERGLAATAALSRAGVSHRRKLQRVAGIMADALDMATRRDLDEAYREIQSLKREVRALRPPLPSGGVSAAVPRRTAKRKPK